MCKWIAYTVLLITLNVVGVCYNFFTNGLLDQILDWSRPGIFQVLSMDLYFTVPQGTPLNAVV